MNFKFNGTEYNLITDVADVTLGQWIKIEKLKAKHQRINMPAELLSLSALEILSNANEGEFDAMLFGQMNELCLSIVELFNKSIDTKDINTTHFELDNVKWSFIKDVNQLTTGEVVDVKALINNRQDEFSFIADVATILIRQVRTITDAYGNVTEEMAPRNSQLFEKHKTIICSFKAKDILPIVYFFLTGLMGQTKDMKMYGKDCQKMIQMNQIFRQNMELGQ